MSRPGFCRRWRLFLLMPGTTTGSGRGLPQWQMRGQHGQQFQALPLLMISAP